MCYFPECVYAKACEPPAAATTFGKNCKTPDDKIIIFATTLWSPEGCLAFMDLNHNLILEKIIAAAKEKGYVRRHLPKLGRNAWIKEEISNWTDEQILDHIAALGWNLKEPMRRPQPSARPSILKRIVKCLLFTSKTKSN